jgi:hypothetical protein
MAVFAAALISVACATVPAPSSAPAAVEDPATAGAVLSACSGGDPRFCHGFIEATFSAAYSRGEVCPPPIEFADVEAIVVPALRQASPDAAATVPATAAIRAAWPCPVAPIPPTTTADEPPMKRRLRPQENFS